MKTKRDKMLLLIDGSNLAHRVFVKFERFIDKNGVKCGLTYGFLRILYQYVHRFDPGYVIVTFDTKESKESNFRNKLLGSYKGHRKQHNLNFDYEEFNRQQKEVQKVLKYLNIPVIIDRKGLGHESDDYIAWCTYEHTAYPRNKVTIVSSDKDFCQLICSDVRVFNPAKEVLIGPYNCKEVMNYTPEECVDYLCLLGDKSDDIPGYFGIGEKRGRAFLDQFGSIEAFLDNPNSEFKGIDREGLEDLYKRNKELIDFTVALKKHKIKRLPIVYHKSGTMNLESVKKIFDSHVFGSLYNKEFINQFKKLGVWTNVSE